MRRIAAIAVVVTLLLGGVLVYAVVGTRLHAQALAPQVIEASGQPQEFERLRAALLNNSLIGTPFVRSLEGEAEDYVLVIYTVELKNRGLLPAQMAEVVVAAKDGDVLCYTDGSAAGTIPRVDIPAGGSGHIRCVLLTRKQERMNLIRELQVSYHIWGRPYFQRVTAR